MSERGGWVWMALQNTKELLFIAPLHVALHPHCIVWMMRLWTSAFPPLSLKSWTYEEGAEWSKYVRSAHFAPAQCRGLHRTNIKCSVSAPTSFLFKPPLSFSRVRKYSFGSVFLCAHLSLPLFLSLSSPCFLSTCTGTRVFFSPYFVFNYYYFP